MTSEAPATGMPGAAAAALISAGIASLVFGAAVFGAETFLPVKEFLTVNEGVGPLSGKAFAGTAAYFLAWAVLHLALRGEVSARATKYWTLGTLAAGLLLTFPPVFQLFAVHA